MNSAKKSEIFKLRDEFFQFTELKDLNQDDFHELSDLGLLQLNERTQIRNQVLEVLGESEDLESVELIQEIISYYSELFADTVFACLQSPSIVKNSFGRIETQPEFILAYKHNLHDELLDPHDENDPLWQEIYSNYSLGMDLDCHQHNLSKLLKTLESRVAQINFTPSLDLFFAMAFSGEFYCPTDQLKRVFRQIYQINSNEAISHIEDFSASAGDLSAIDFLRKLKLQVSSAPSV